MAETSNFFFNLTPDIVIKALEQSGFDPTGHCLALNSYENRVYDLRLEDGSHAVAKFYRPGRWSRDQILEEHRFLFDLRDDEIPVCAPLPLPGGDTLHEIEGILYAVWPRTGGRVPDELSDTELQILGRLCARIHNNGAAKKAPHRIELTGETYGLQPLAFLEKHDFLPPHCKDRYRNAVMEVVEIYETLRKDVPFHRIHGDCHLGNLLHGTEGWFFLDFDDFLTGPAVQDLWMLVPARDSEGLRQREVFLEAYRQFRDFDGSWLRMVEPLRSLRYIRYAAWIAQRWDDPAFPAAFPHFGTVDYWEAETRDLEDQLDYFYNNTNDLPQAMQRAEDKPEEKELTNKDFFWDWEDKK
ncbi:MAG: serine/threonine protein kinase [Spirochaetes bacterium]|nr:serine/threonine protein kinase [Spirochaetota bacterium]